MRHWVFAVAMGFAFAAHAGPPEWVAAKVVKVEPDRSRVTLDHERITSIDMEAMVMPFKVQTGVDLKPFKPGDKVRFRVANKDDRLVVEAMEKSK
jgi:Cu/Ag efflux protein CusF